MFFLTKRNVKKESDDSEFTLAEAMVKRKRAEEKMLSVQKKIEALLRDISRKKDDTNS